MIKSFIVGLLLSVTVSFAGRDPNENNFDEKNQITFRQQATIDGIKKICEGYLKKPNTEKFKRSLVQMCPLLALNEPRFHEAIDFFSKPLEINNLSQYINENFNPFGFNDSPYLSWGLDRIETHTLQTMKKVMDCYDNQKKLNNTPSENDKLMLKTNMITKLIDCPVEGLSSDHFVIQKSLEILQNKFDDKNLLETIEYYRQVNDGYDN